jgi:hypothetical protein
MDASDIVSIAHQTTDIGTKILCLSGLCIALTVTIIFVWMIRRAFPPDNHRDR